MSASAAAIGRRGEWRISHSAIAGGRAGQSDSETAGGVLERTIAPVDASSIASLRVTASLSASRSDELHRTNLLIGRLDPGHRSIRVNHPSLMMPSRPARLDIAAPTASSLCLTTRNSRTAPEIDQPSALFLGGVLNRSNPGRLLRALDHSLRATRRSLHIVLKQPATNPARWRCTRRPTAAVRLRIARAPRFPMT